MDTLFIPQNFLDESFLAPFQIFRGDTFQAEVVDISNGQIRLHAIPAGKFELILIDDEIYNADGSPRTFIPGQTLSVTAIDHDPDQFGYQGPDGLIRVQITRGLQALDDESLDKLITAWREGTILEGQVEGFTLKEQKAAAVRCLDCNRIIYLENLLRNGATTSFWDLSDYSRWLDDHGFDCPICHAKDYERLQWKNQVKARLIIKIGDATGILDLSHLDRSHGLNYNSSREEVQEVFQSMVNGAVYVVVSYLNEEANVLYFDEREAMNKLRAQQAEKLWGQLGVDQRYQARVTNIVGPIVFLELEGCLTNASVHISELQHRWTFNPSSVVKLGDIIEVEITDIDCSNHRVTCSRKACLPNPWDSSDFTWQVGDITEGIMTYHRNDWVYIQIDDNGISGSMPLDELPNGFVRGGKIQVEIVSIIRSRRRMQLVPLNNKVEGKKPQTVFNFDAEEPTVFSWGDDTIFDFSDDGTETLFDFGFEPEETVFSFDD